MSLLRWLQAKKSDAGATGGRKPRRSFGQTTLPLISPRRGRRILRREQLFSVVRESLIRAGVLSTSYEFKVLALDSTGDGFLVLINLTLPADVMPDEYLLEIERWIQGSARSRHSMQVQAVYWRRQPVHDLRGVALKASVAAQTRREGAAASGSARPLAPEQVAAFRSALETPALPAHRMESPAVAMLKGVVTLPIAPEPAYCEALKGVTKGVVRLKATDAKPFTVLGCDGKPPVFVGFDPAKDQPRSEYILAWDFTGVAPADLKLWWVVETNRADCPLIPLRVRNENTGSKFDQARTGRFWHVPESLVSAGLLAPGQPFEGSVEIEHYNPKARGAVEKPEWSQVRGVKSLSPLATAEFLGSQMDGDKCAIRFRFTPSAAAAGRFIWVPMEIQTATGSGPFFVVASVRAPAGSAVPSK